MANSSNCVTVALVSARLAGKNLKVKQHTRISVRAGRWDVLCFHFVLPLKRVKKRLHTFVLSSLFPASFPPNAYFPVFAALVSSPTIRTAVT